MACCNPDFLLPTREFERNGYWFRYPHGIQIPCGYCLNCRVDRRNQWSDRCKWELKNRLCGAFVTLTYDDVHIADVTTRSPVTEKLQSSLQYKHVTDFIARLRKYVKRHSEINGVLCQPDFSYLYVGEYGENGQVFDRPHFHVLFFGLDFAFMRKIMTKEWYFGFIDVLPILDGGINYVLKYLDKQLFGDMAKKKYDIHLLARPRQGQSKSFGASLYVAKKQEILDNNLTYQSGHVRRPVPMYYKKKLFGDDFSRWNDKVVRDTVRFNKVRVIDQMRTTYKLKDYSWRSRDNFKKFVAQIKERKLRQAMLNDGIGVYDHVLGSECDVRYDRDRIRSLSPDIARWLATDYIKSISIGGLTDVQAS